MRTIPPPGGRRLFLARLRRRPLVAAALFGLAALVGLAAAAPLISPHDPYALIPGETLRPPTARFPFGTDDLGRDIL
ncbi:MAG: peptide ABC transporter permease, partial [Candidatus Methylomirabilaceae bacterium]